MISREVSGWLVLAAYVATIFAANYFIGHVGNCVPDGPCTIPVGFGLSAPSGVLWVGISLFLRDMVQERLGRAWALAAIVLGAALSYFVASPFVALASALAFFISELADFAVYQPLRRRNLAAAVLVSGIVGGLVDSAVFLYAAFGSLDFLLGQFLGKTWMTLLAAALIWLARRQRGSVSAVS